MSCCVGDQTIDIFAGDDLRVRVAVRDTKGGLVDVTQATEIRWQAFARIGDPPIITRSLSGADITVDGPSVFFFDLFPADTANNVGAFRHEADIVNSAGDTYTILQGQLTVRPVQLT